MARREAHPTSTPVIGRLEALTITLVVGILALALGLAGLARSGQATTVGGLSYTQSGSFAYSGTAAPGSIYGKEGLTAGEPIIPSYLGPVTAGFSYKLTAPATASVRGIASLVAVVTPGSGLSRSFVVSPSRAFTGSGVDVQGRLPISKIIAYMTSANGALGNVGSLTGTVQLVARIKVSGVLGGHPFAAAFTPELSFGQQSDALVLTGGQGSAIATAQLAPSQNGTVHFRIAHPETLPLLFVHPSGNSAEAVGFTFAALLLLLSFFLGRPLLRGHEGGHEPARIRALYGSQLLPVRAVTIPSGPVAEVATIASLAELAKRYESMIMHLVDDRGDAYLVWDNGMLYRYRPQRDREGGAVLHRLPVPGPGMEFADRGGLLRDLNGPGSVQ